MSLRIRFIVGTTLIFAVALFWTYRTLNDEVRPRYKEAVEESLVDLAQITASMISVQAKTSGLNPKLLAEVFEDLRTRPIQAKIFGIEKNDLQFNAYVTDEKGIVLYDTSSPENVGKDYSRWNDVLLTLQGRYGARSTRANPEQKLSSVLYVAAPILIGGKISGVVSISKPERALEKFLRKTQTQLATVSLVAGSGVLVLAIVFSMAVTRPIDKLIEYAQKNRGEERFPLPRMAPPEFRRLGEAFEEMRLSLEGRKSIEAYVQTLTHEIKSPLTAIRGAAELCQEDMSEENRRRFLGNIRTEAERIQKLVETLLDISSLESRKGLIEATTLDLNAVVEDVVISLEPVFVRKGVRLSFQPSEENLSFQGEGFLVTQSIRNLLQNALDFSPEGGTIEIRTRRQSDRVALTIVDEGPGIPDFALPRLFEKFYSLGRPQTGKKSSGLGLSFVKEVALLHRGKVEINNRQSQNGTTGAVATLILPI